MFLLGKVCRYQERKTTEHPKKGLRWDEQCVGRSGQTSIFQLAFHRERIMAVRMSQPQKYILFINKKDTKKQN